MSQEQIENAEVNEEPPEASVEAPSEAEPEPEPKPEQKPEPEPAAAEEAAPPPPPPPPPVEEVEVEEPELTAQPPAEPEPQPEPVPAEEKSESKPEVRIGSKLEVKIDDKPETVTSEVRIKEGPASEIPPEEQRPSLVKSVSGLEAVKSKSSTMRTTSSTLQRSSLIYKHEFSALDTKESEPKDESLRKGLDSKGKIALGSVISIHRASLTGDQLTLRTARYMNTYRLESENPFNSEKVGKILESVVLEALENLTYDPDKCAKQAKWASSAIRAAVKDLKFDRYKLICLMTIGEKNSQDVYATCRFLWDIERDSYAVYAHENTYVYGYAQCFGLYYE